MDISDNSRIFGLAKQVASALEVCSWVRSVDVLQHGLERPRAAESSGMVCKIFSNNVTNALRPTRARRCRVLSKETPKAMQTSFACRQISLLL